MTSPGSWHLRRHQGQLLGARGLGKVRVRKALSGSLTSDATSRGSSAGRERRWLARSGGGHPRCHDRAGEGWAGKRLTGTTREGPPTADGVFELSAGQAALGLKKRAALRRVCGESAEGRRRQSRRWERQRASRRRAAAVLREQGPSSAGGASFVEHFTYGPPGGL